MYFKYIANVFRSLLFLNLQQYFIKNVYTETRTVIKNIKSKKDLYFECQLIVKYFEAKMTRCFDRMK